MRLQRESRPVGNPDGSHKATYDGTTSIPRFTPEMAAARSQGMLLLMVHDPASGRFRRRIFLTLGAAEKAAERARERGHVAHIVLGRFSVVEVV